MDKNFRFFLFFFILITVCSQTFFAQNNGKYKIYRTQVDNISIVVYYASALEIDKKNIDAFANKVVKEFGTLQKNFLPAGTPVVDSRFNMSFIYPMEEKDSCILPFIHVKCLLNDGSLFNISLIMGAKVNPRTAELGETFCYDFYFDQYSTVYSKYENMVEKYVKSSFK